MSVKNAVGYKEVRRHDAPRRWGSVSRPPKEITVPCNRFYGRIAPLGIAVNLFAAVQAKGDLKGLAHGTERRGVGGQDPRGTDEEMPSRWHR